MVLRIETQAASTDVFYRRVRRFHKKRLEWNDQELPKALPGYSGGKLPGRGTEEKGREEGEGEGSETQDAPHICQLDYVNLIFGELGGFRGGKHSAALFHKSNRDVRMAVHGDDCLCLSGDDGLQHIDSLFKSKYIAKDMGTLGFEDSDVKSFCC